jgi:hypothetical protein
VDVGTTDAGSCHCDLGFDYSPDAFYDGMVREVKTSRSFYEPTSIDDLGTYIEQVLIYMMATETLRTPLARAILASPLCREWKCGARNCEYYDQCQPERIGRQVPGAPRASASAPSAP